MHSHIYLIYCCASLTVAQSLQSRDLNLREIYPRLSRRGSPTSDSPSKDFRSPLTRRGSPRGQSSPKKAVANSAGLIVQKAREAVDSASPASSSGTNLRPNLRAGQGAMPIKKFHRPSRPQSPISAISGHPNSAMVVATGPGAIQVQQVGQETITEDVKKGQIKMLNAKNDHGVYASALIGEGGAATAASTGNAAAGYIGAGKPATGYIEKYEGDIHTSREAVEGRQLRMHAKGSKDGQPRSATLSSIEGEGHVTAVGSSVDLPQEPDHAPQHGGTILRKLQASQRSRRGATGV